MSIQGTDTRESQGAKTHRLLAILTYNGSKSYKNNIKNRDDCVSYTMSTKLSIRTILARDSSIESVSLSPGKKPRVEGVVLTESGGISNTRGRHPRTDEISEALVKYQTYKSHGAKQNRDRAVRALLLEPVAGATGYKQYIPQEVTIRLLSTETGSESLSEPIQNTLLKLQRLDPFVTRRQYESKPYRRATESNVGHWRVGEADGLLRYRGAVYMPAEQAIRYEII